MHTITGAVSDKIVDEYQTWFIFCPFIVATNFRNIFRV